MYVSRPTKYVCKEKVYFHNQILPITHIITKVYQIRKDWKENSANIFNGRELAIDVYFFPLFSTSQTLLRVAGSVRGSGTLRLGILKLNPGRLAESARILGMRLVRGPADTPTSTAGWFVNFG